MPGKNHFDVIVIGAGSMGSSACWFLAQRGLKVLGLEQFDIVHDKGSHAGQSRIIRKAYFEHPDYVPLLERAYENWKSFEERTNASIYQRTGIVYFGKPDSETMQGVKTAASMYNVAVDHLSRKEDQKHLSAFSIPSDFEILYEYDSGFVTPERAIRLYIQDAIKSGAVIKTNTKVESWKRDGNIIDVKTEGGSSYTCDKLIITAGSWSSKIIPNLKIKLQVTRQMLAWINPKNWETFSLGNFPCWFIDDPERGLFYGYPILPSSGFDGPIGLKLAHHHGGVVCDPDELNPSIPKGTEEEIMYVLEKYIPEAANSILTIKHCMYTNSDDLNFIIDHLPGYDKDVVVACGFSGHGFKFVSVIGEILADLATKGYTDLPIEFLKLSRFR
jgi:sarcosine oxidase